MWTKISQEIKALLISILYASIKPGNDDVMLGLGLFQMVSLTAELAQIRLNK
jgi:hypothetical protein